jgi:hypothetical protein
VNGQVPGAFQVVTDGVGVEDDLRILSDAFSHADDIHFLIAELAEAGAAAVVRRDAGFPLGLAGNHEHRNGIRPCAEHTI